MNKDQVSGTVKKGAGKVQQAAVMSLVAMSKKPKG